MKRIFLVLLVTFGVTTAEAALPPIPGEGIWMGFSTSFGKHLAYLDDLVQYDIGDGAQTDFIPRIDYSIEYGGVLLYRGRIAEGGLTVASSQEWTANHLRAHEPEIVIDGEDRFAWGPSFTAVGFTGRFFVLDPEAFVAPFLTGSLLFRTMRIYNGSIDTESGWQSDSVYMGDGYEIGLGVELGPINRFSLALNATYCHHRYMWVRGALGRSFVLPESIEGGGFYATATMSLLLNGEPGATQSQWDSPIGDLLRFIIWGS